MPTIFDPQQINADSAAWELYEVGNGFRRFRLELEPGKFIIRTEYLADDELIADNKRLYDESLTQRFGDGKVVARIPLNKFFSELGSKIKEGDEEHLRWWLNRDQARPYRTFRGKL